MRLNVCTIPTPNAPPHETDASDTLTILTGPTDLSLVTPRKSFDQHSRSTLKDEYLGELVDLSGSRSWGNRDLCEGIRDYGGSAVSAPNHEELMEAIVAVCVLVLRSPQHHGSGASKRLQSVESSVAALSESLCGMTSGEGGRLSTCFGEPCGIRSRRRTHGH